MLFDRLDQILRVKTGHFAGVLYLEQLSQCKLMGKCLFGPCITRLALNEKLTSKPGALPGGLVRICVCSDNSYSRFWGGQGEVITALPL